MAKFTIEGESMDEIGNALKNEGVIGPNDPRFEETTDVFAELIEAVEDATQRTNGRGNQQSKIAEYAGLHNRYSSEQVGDMLDVLSYFGHVEKVDRRYRSPQ
ncbi:hypothetical protein DP107_14185 [Haloglomus irregulare]|jgi:hypothetical protein|uniref:Uncharacterized protein n=1 Tax=Haloglomus irregulare TaxID=2234134 RepID=A0A554MXG5_9EURY|nr:hypothetical protein [Haloglomus irregulare]TSD09799.1 hypothetical protein DP107_14185 [Haloglomus irregulare]